MRPINPRCTPSGLIIKNVRSIGSLSHYLQCDLLLDIVGNDAHLCILTETTVYRKEAFHSNFRHFLIVLKPERYTLLDISNIWTK